MCREAWFGGKPVKTVITKVGGAEEELDTKLYKVPMCKGGGQFVQMIQALGIPQISEETPAIDVSKIARFFDLPAGELHRKSRPVDLSVGINYPRFRGRDESKGWSRGAKKSFGVGRIWKQFKRCCVGGQKSSTRPSCHARRPDRFLEDRIYGSVCVPVHMRRSQDVARRANCTEADRRFM